MPEKPLVLFGNGSHLNLGCQAIDVGTACGFSELGVGALTFMPARMPFQSDVVSQAAGLTVSVDAVLSDALASTTTRVVRKLAGVLPASMRPGSIAPFIGVGPARGARAALALGGDNYTLDYGPPDVFFGVNRAMVRAGVPLFMWGASIGPFRSTPAYERMVTRELDLTRSIFAREDVTSSYVSGLGVSTPVRRMSDPAFLMPTRAPADESVGQGLSEAIGLNLSPLIGEKRGVSPSQWAEECAVIVARLIREFDREIALVPHVTVPSSDDRALMLDVLARLDESALERVRLLPEGLDALETKWVIGRMAAFIGARTHATIAALSQGVPTISLGYSSKAVGINLDVLGHERFVIGFDELNADRLITTVRVLLAESDVVRHALLAALPRVQSRSRRGFEQLLADLETTPVASGTRRG